VITELGLWWIVVVIVLAVKRQIVDGYLGEFEIVGRQADERLGESAV
jgi:hypothetical protein